MSVQWRDKYESVTKMLKESKQASAYELEALKRGHDAVVENLKNKLSSSEKDREQLLKSIDDIRATHEKETLDRIHVEVEAAVADAVLDMEAAENEALEIMRATCEVTTSQEVATALEEAAIVSSANTEEAVAVAVSNAQRKFKSGEALRMKVAVDEAVEVALINAEATFKKEKEEALCQASAEMALEAQIHRERDLEDMRVANEEAMTTTVMEMVHDMDAEFDEKLNKLQQQHGAALKSLQNDIENRDIELSRLKREKRESVDSALEKAKQKHETHLSQVLADANAEAEAAAAEAEAIVAQAKAEMAEKLVGVREATAAQAAKEHSERLQAALAVAAAEADARIASLEQSNIEINQREAAVRSHAALEDKEKTVQAALAHAEQIHETELARALAEAKANAKFL